MLPGNGIGDTDKTCFTKEDQYKFKYGSEGLNTADIKEYIRNPHKFNIKWEMDGKYYNLWSTASIGLQVLAIQTSVAT